jgi:hypothetical protein
MKTLEFEATLNPDDSLTVPAEVAAQLQKAQPLRVILVVPEPHEDEREWARLTAEQFLGGYDEGDAIYDELPVR